MEQRTNEWYNARLGKFTASNIYKLFAARDWQKSKVYQDYIYQLAFERKFNVPADNTPQTFAMRRGVELEPVARETAAQVLNCKITETGFVDFVNADILAGVSPDGLIGEDGLIEIKCPMPIEFMRFFSTHEPKKEHILQMQMQMLVTGRAYCHYFVYTDAGGGGYAMETINYDESVASDILDRMAVSESLIADILNK